MLFRSYLFNLDKNLHKSQKKLQDDLTNYFKLYEADAEDLINIGLVPVDLKQNIINSIHNINKNIKMMTGSGGSAFLDYKEIKYPILLRDDSNFDIEIPSPGKKEDAKKLGENEKIQ